MQSSEQNSGVPKKKETDKLRVLEVPEFKHVRDLEDELQK